MQEKIRANIIFTQMRVAKNREKNIRKLLPLSAYAAAYKMIDSETRRFSISQ